MKPKSGIENTPTPWNFAFPSGAIFCPATGQQVATTYRRPFVGIKSDEPDAEERANAALIVRAVNSHAEPVAALESLLPHAEKLLEAAGAIDGLLDSKTNAEYDIEQAKTALEKAGAK